MQLGRTSFVRIPTGDYRIGLPLAQMDLLGIDGDNDCLECVRTVSEYWISVNLVTVLDWHEFTSATGLDWPEWANLRAVIASNLSPVALATWHEARQYAAWFGRRHGVKASLPSEGQWEIAARGPEAWICPWSEASTLPVPGWAGHASGTRPLARCGSWPDLASPFGVQDLLTHVQEWCGDVYVSFPVPDGGRPEEVTIFENYRPVRGTLKDTWCFPRSTYRESKFPDCRSECIGFRLVLSTES